MAAIEKLFVTQIYRAELGSTDVGANSRLRQACLGIAAEDRAGQTWCRQHGYCGYTSYASLTDLPQRASVFHDLVDGIDRHVTRFARALDFDLGRARLNLDSMWINVLDPGGHHAAHLHPHSVVSGTYYVDVPKAASAIRFEDPRLALMMAAPPRLADARPANRTFVTLTPRTGSLLLWESWLRHEVPASAAQRPRISISFNYKWG